MSNEAFQTQNTQPFSSPTAQGQQPSHPQGDAFNPGQPVVQTAQSPVLISPGTYPPTGLPPPQFPQVAPGFPDAVHAPAFPQSSQPPTQFAQEKPRFVIYNGIYVPNPEAPAAPHGTQKVPGYNPERDLPLVKNAKKSGVFGSGWSDAKLTDIFVGKPLAEIDALSDYFVSTTGETLVDFLPSKGKVSGWFYEVIHALALGPLGYDVELAKKATSGIGTDESVLMELLLNRSNNDIEVLKRAYMVKWGSNLVEDVKKDLSSGTKALYIMALNAQRPQGFPDAAQVDKDVDEMNAHGLGKGTKFDEIFYCQFFVNRSDLHIASVIDKYNQKYKSLSKVIKTNTSFSKDVKQGLLYIIHGVKSKRNRHEPYGVWRDAKMIEKAMAGAGTNDKALVYRVVRASWNYNRFQAIKAAYHQRYGKEMKKRVSGETSGSYQTILLKLIDLPPPKA